MTDFSYQLYSSRNFPPLSETLKMLARLGYTSVEGFGALLADAAKVGELKQHLDAAGLTMPTGHFGIDMLENEPARVLEITRSVGIGTIYCPFLTPDQRPDSGAGWEAFGRRLQDCSKPYRDAGLGFGWHNHDFEFKRTADGVMPQDAIFAGGEDLEWEADVAWVVRGGADPFTWIERYGDRITAVHVKDIAPAGENLDEDGWADVGHGTVAWPALMKALRKTPVKHFVMEHDNPKDAARFAERSIASARSY